MKNIWKIVSFILCFCMLFPFTVYGQGQNRTGEQTQTGAQQIPQERQLPRLVDEAGLLSQKEADKLLAELDEISERQQFDVVIAAVNSLEGQNVTDFADDFYDYNGYGAGDDRDGILFLVAMREREWAISTCGFGIYAFTDAGQEYLVDRFHSDLSDGEYYDAFMTFAEWSDQFVTQAREGEPYDEGHLPITVWNIIVCIAIGLAAGFCLAFFRVGVMKWNMRTVYHQAAATNYLVDGSLRMKDNRERLVRTAINRIRIEQNHQSGGGGGSSVHTSSSGTTHGGSHGKF